SLGLRAPAPRAPSCVFTGPPTTPVYTLSLHDALPIFKEALALYQATRKPVTDTLQQVSHQGWSEDEIDEVFPGQKPAAAAAKERPMPLHPETAKVLAGLPAPPAGPPDPPAARPAAPAQVPTPQGRRPPPEAVDPTAATAAAR